MEKEFLKSIILNLFIFAMALSIPFLGNKMNKTKKVMRSNYYKAVDKLIFTAIGIIYITPLLLDTPQIIKGEYSYMEGVVVKEVAPMKRSIGEEHRGTVHLKDTTTGEIMEIDVLNTKLFLDDIAVVKYLPNLKIGVAVESGEWDSVPIAGNSSIDNWQAVDVNEVIAIEISLLILAVMVVCSKNGKKKWMVYGKTELHNKMILAIAGSFLAILFLFMLKGKAALSSCIVLTGLCVILFILGMTIQHMGIKKETDHILVFPLLGRSEKIYFDKLGEAVSYLEDGIEIKAKDKTILKINDRFYGYEEFCEFLKENGACITNET